MQPPDSSQPIQNDVNASPNTQQATTEDITPVFENGDSVVTASPPLTPAPLTEIREEEDAGYVVPPPRHEQPTMHTVEMKLLPIWSALILFSFIGVLIRIGIIRLHSYPSPAVAPTIYAQAVGSFIMGFVNYQKGWWMVHSYPFYVGLTTGLSGSITSFSTYMLTVFLELFHIDYVGKLDRTVGEGVMAGIAIIVSTIGLSTASVVVGGHASMIPFLHLRSYVRIPSRIDIDDYDAELKDMNKIRLMKSRQNPTLHECLHTPFKALQKLTHEYTTLTTVEKLLVWSALLSIILFALLIGFIRTEIGLLFACLFGPVGTLIRYHTATLNVTYGVKHAFPMGTYLVNMIGTALIGVFFIFQYDTPGVGLSGYGCGIMMGLIDGFCGCLTTVSAFIVELRTLPRAKDSWRYAVASVGVGQCLLVLIVGSVFWSGTGSGMGAWGKCSADIVSV